MLSEWGNNMKMPAFLSEKYQSCVQFFESTRNAVRQRVISCVKFLCFQNGEINMKMPAFFSKIEQFCAQLMPLPNRNLSWIEEIRILNALSRRVYSPLKKTISMEELYYIVGHFDEKSLSQHPDNEGKHPVDTKEVDVGYHKPAHENVFDLASYNNRVEKKIHKLGFENYIEIDKEPKNVLISEKDKYYHPKCKITIKNLIINTHDERRAMFFYSPTSPSDSVSGKDGIYLIFENNSFIGKDHQGNVDFYPREGAYFIFKNNIFKSVNMFLTTEQTPKIELKDNIFLDSNVEIPAVDSNRFTRDNIISLDDNIFYRIDRNSSILKVGIDCYFKGKNTVDNLILSSKSLHWGGYQNIDPQGNHAYTHKQMFIGFMENAVKSNDKMQEARLRRELMKCERALLREENMWHSFQDKIILKWSSWISDYGISWFLPLARLAFINAVFTGMVFNHFENKPPWDFLLLVFVKFLNPLNNLSDMAGIDDNVWISSITIFQKAFLAICLYEVIKVFRRFSSK